MLCSLLSAIPLFSLFNSTYLASGTVFMSKSSEPVAIQLNLNHHHVTILNDVSYRSCLSPSSIALPETDVSFRYNKYQAVEHYLIMNKNAEFVKPKRSKCKELLSKKDKEMEEKLKKDEEEDKKDEEEHRKREEENQKHEEENKKDEEENNKDEEENDREERHRIRKIKKLRAFIRKRLSRKIHDDESEPKPTERAEPKPTERAEPKPTEHVEPKPTEHVEPKPMRRIIKPVVRKQVIRKPVIISRPISPRMLFNPRVKPVFINKLLTRLQDKKEEVVEKLKDLRSDLKSVESKKEFKQLRRQFIEVARLKKMIQRNIAKVNVAKFNIKQKNFAVSDKGQSAKKLCVSLGAKGKSLTGCMQDMAFNVPVPVLKAAIQQTQKTVSKRVVMNDNGRPSRTCTANGDPHYTNFNGEYFHVQVPAITTFAKTDDGIFEVQIKQDGSTGPGSPSYVRAVAIRYAGQIYHGRFKADGFSVQSGPSWVSVTVPGRYENKMTGICGQNSASAGMYNYKLPNNNVADVNYGKAQWAIGGYGGRNTKLSKWQLAWRPSLADCMFSVKECANNLQDITERKRRRFISTPFGVIDTNKA